jgi:hypothetical protein
MRPIDASVQLSSAAIMQMIHSPLRRHVACLTTPYTAADGQQMISFDQLALLAQRMPHLHSLDVYFQYLQGTLAVPPIPFPRHLKDMCVHFPVRPTRNPAALALHSVHIEAVIDAAASLEHLQTFELDGLDSTHLLAPLGHCASLRSLQLSWYGSNRVTNAQIVALRTMKQLTQLVFVMNDARHHVTAAWVQLLSTPPYLSLQSVGESEEPLLLSAELTALLPRLPSLTALCVSVSDSSFLAGVSRVSPCVPWKCASVNCRIPPKMA